MKKKLAFALVLLLFMFALSGCGGKATAPGNEEPGEETTATGTLVFTANGEEFIREGFVSKDGWALSFEHAYVTLGSIVAYQTDPPYDTEQGWDFSYQEKVELPGVYTVDLALPESDPAIVGEAEAPAGRYNALSWDLVKAPSGPAEGYFMVLEGTAEKDGETISFVLRFDKEVSYLGGDYVGDERKGILEKGGTADVEMTFHFDHMFGDGDEDENDSLNTEALGFGPLAAIAENGSLDVNLADLEVLLDAGDYDKLVHVFTHLAHVGEGHCLAKFK